MSLSHTLRPFPTSWPPRVLPLDGFERTSQEPGSISVPRKLKNDAKH
jgi:hypothetical protein